MILIHGLRRKSPRNSAGIINSKRVPRFLRYALVSTPAIVSRRAFIPYLNGIYGESVLKGAGRTSIGKVPPEPAICMTSMMTAEAFQITLNVIVREYIMSV